MTPPERVLLEVFEQFKVALAASGGATAGLYVQTVTPLDALGSNRASYRVARRPGNDGPQWPLGEETRRAVELASALELATAALGMVPPDDTPL